MPKGTFSTALMHTKYFMCSEDNPLTVETELKGKWGCRVVPYPSGAEPRRSPIRILLHILFLFAYELQIGEIIGEGRMGVYLILYSYEYSVPVKRNLCISILDRDLSANKKPAFPGIFM